MEGRHFFRRNIINYAVYSRPKSYFTRNTQTTFFPTFWSFSPSFRLVFLIVQTSQFNLR